jgi:hypothetical protein
MAKADRSNFNSRVAAFASGAPPAAVAALLCWKPWQLDQSSFHNGAKSAKSAFCTCKIVNSRDKSAPPVLSSDQLLFHKKLLQEDEDTSQKCREKQECVSNFNPGQKISPAQFLAQEEII